MTAYIAAGLNLQTRTKFLLETKGCMSNHIIQTVSQELNIPFEKIFERTRKRGIVEARQISTYLIKKKTKMALKNIGELFFQDHATIIYAIKTVNDLCDSDKSFRRKVERIEEAI